MQRVGLAGFGQQARLALEPRRSDYSLALEPVVGGSEQWSAPAGFRRPRQRRAQECSTHQ